FEHKRILVCRDREEAISLLLHFDPDDCPQESDFSTKDFFKSETCYRVPLPTYPFEKKRYWIDPPTTDEEFVSVDAQCRSVENILTDTWKEFLGTEFIGVHDDFFQLGGDSLLAIKV